MWVIKWLHGVKIQCFQAFVQIIGFQKYSLYYGLSNVLQALPAGKISTDKNAQKVQFSTFLYKNNSWIVVSVISGTKIKGFRWRGRLFNGNNFLFTMSIKVNLENLINFFRINSPPVWVYIPTRPTNHRFLDTKLP